MDLSKRQTYPFFINNTKVDPSLSQDILTARPSFIVYFVASLYSFMLCAQAMAPDAAKIALPRSALTPMPHSRYRRGEHRKYYLLGHLTSSLWYQTCKLAWQNNCIQL